MIEAAQVFAILVFGLTGLSHLLAPRVWADFFARAAADGERGSLTNAAIHLPLGLVIAAFHPVWTWPGIVLTLMGWSLVAKSALYMCFPRFGAAALARGGSHPASAYQAGGVFSLAVAAFVAWLRFA